ncbi:MAG: hypothetical protein ACE5HN_06605 [Nitrospiria bacterium]
MGQWPLLVKTPLYQIKPIRLRHLAAAIKEETMIEAATIIFIVTILVSSVFL